MYFMLDTKSFNCHKEEVAISRKDFLYDECQMAFLFYLIMGWKLKVAGFVFVIWQLFSLYNVIVPPNLCKSSDCIVPKYDLEKQKFDMCVYAVDYESYKYWDMELILSGDENTVFSKLDFELNEGFEEVLNLTMKGNDMKMSLVSIIRPASAKKCGRRFEPADITMSSIPLTHHRVPSGEELVYLLGNETIKKEDKKEAQPHWKPWVKLRCVLDSNSYERDGSKIKTHKPHIYFEELFFHDNQYRLISERNKNLTTTFKFMPIGVGTYRGLQVLEQTIQHLRTAFKLSKVETDEVLLLLSPDNLYILALTYTVSLLHSVFAFMAFKNEISFWRSSASMYGLSRRSVIGNAFCGVILFLFLFDSPNTSWLICGTMLVSAVIDLWKVTRILGWTGSAASRDWTEAEIETNKIDADGMKYLWWLLYPSVVGFAIYSLLYHRHKSLYSWIINSLARGVYGFGFLMMWPQIFVNYRLKSVAHLPWRALTYKIFSTFVDDIFAFVINAPMIHRLATLRDDVVFFVYLFQRFYYKVDYSRVNEFGQKVQEEELEDKEKKD